MLNGLSDRLPPQNIEAEEGVLGSILLNNDVLLDVAEVVRPSDFYRRSHEVTFREILALDEAGVGVDHVTLRDAMTRSGTFDEAGGDEFLARLLSGVPHWVNAKYYADIVRQKAIARRLIEAANETLREAYSDTFTAGELVAMNERRTLDLADAEGSGKTTEAGEAGDVAIELIMDRRGGAITGVTSGISEVDFVTCGFQPEQLVYIAGRPSMGKTALLMNIAEHAAFDRGLRVLAVSIEMGSIPLAERLLISRSGVDGHKVRTGRISGDDIERLAAAHAEFAAAPLTIDGSPTRTMLQVGASARRTKLLHGRLDLVVVDYVQYIDGDDPKAPIREQMNQVSRRLKGLAREMKVPVIAAAQLHRGPENRVGNRPRMSDLKESGNLEQDADIVMLLHRPEYYDPNDSPGTATIIIAKNRNGPTGDVPVTYVKRLMRFDSPSGRAAPGGS